MLNSFAQTASYFTTFDLGAVACLLVAWAAMGVVIERAEAFLRLPA